MNAVSTEEHASKSDPEPARRARARAGITRRLVAQRLGVSERTVRRLETDGTLHPRGGHGETRLFDEREVEAVARSRGLAPSTGSDEGQVAAMVFAMLDEGASLVDVVKRTKMAPAEVEQLHAQRERLLALTTDRDEARLRVVHERARGDADETAVKQATGCTREDAFRVSVVHRGAGIRALMAFDRGLIAWRTLERIVIERPFDEDAQLAILTKMGIQVDEAALFGEG